MSITADSDEEVQKLLATPINNLGLTIPGSKLESQIAQLYDELRAKNILFHPECYLSDEWGCPHDAPLIGIPFYLADETLRQMEAKYTSVEAETDDETMKYLRHEAGHALNYAYKLYLHPRWEKIFGPFSRPYKERYEWIPQHKSFVVHLPEWYAQKHPDEDFAETFAVWLTPELNWKELYKDTPAFIKLSYTDELMRKVGFSHPFVTTGEKDVPVEEIDMTLQEWYDEQQIENTSTTDDN